MEFEDSYFDYRKESWQSSFKNEPRNIEYVLGEVFFNPNKDGNAGWIDKTGFIGDFEQAKYLVSCLRREFRGEFFEEGVKLLSSGNKRHFVKYMVMTLNPLQKGRFETYFADFLECNRDNIAGLALYS